MQRNRVKRIIRETYQQHSDRFPEHGYLLFLIKRCGDREAIEAEIFDLAAKAVEIMNRELGR